MKKTLIILTICLTLLAAACGFLAAIATKIALFSVFINLTPVAPLMGETNILVLGADSAFGHRSDTIMLLRFDPLNKQAEVLSIPRDTLAVIPGRGLDKINHAYAYGGVELSRRAVEELLRVKIPYHIIIDLGGIIKLVDDLGGITLNVDHRMYYVDYSGGLNINLQPGLQTLSGEQAMGYLRYRSDGGDLKRINRQQQFLLALANAIVKKESLVKTPGYFFSLLSAVDTNLHPKQVVGLSIGLHSAYELGRIRMETLPGKDTMVDGIYYLLPDQQTIPEISKRFGGE